MQRSRSFKRTVTVLLVMTLAVVSLLSVPFIQAQDGGQERRLGVGQAVTGSLSAENFAESYVFDASEGDSATLTATTASTDLSLALLLTGPDGTVVARDGDLATANVATLANVALPLTGTYVVTVMRGTGADGEAAGDYTLALTGSITTPTGNEGPVETTSPGQAIFVQLDEGTVDIQLSWTAAVDLNLEVRDPIGGAIYWENPNVSSGGSHGGNTNQDCAEATADNPTENVTWTSSSVPVGSYEVLVYYQQGCDVGGPQDFTLTTAIDGDEPATISGRLNPGQIYLARVELDREKNWSLFNGGVNAGLDVSLVGDPQPIETGQEVTGTITNEDVADSYTFEANAGQTIALGLNATSGSLDTLLIVVNANGQRVADNDDGSDGTTNSDLQFTAPTDGTYTVIATRYGQTIGGTEGDYSLSLQLPSATAAEGTSEAPTTSDTGTTTADVAGLTPGSVEVRLTWATEADLQLLVRDPSGSSVFDDEPTITSGGILEAVGNQGCVISETTPVSYIYWPESRIPPRGTYEVEVWYQSECNDTRRVNFNLSIEVNGATVFETTETPTLGSRFMVSFTVNNDSSVDVSDSGFFLMSDVRDGIEVSTAVTGAQPIEYDSIAQGTITQEQKFVVYSFEGRVGDRLSVSLQQTTGNLDTAVYVLGPAPAYLQLSFNDDIEPGVNTNSRITSVQLQEDGTHYIVATHYGLRYGGTEGNYTLNLTQLP